jgi:ubiquitin-protein ligase
MNFNCIARQPIIITKQLNKMKPNEHFTIAPKDPDSTREYLILLHPQGGYFKNQMHVLEFKTVYGRGDDTKYFPFSPPNIRFLTDIYHTNVSKQGTICLDILKEASKWSPQYSIETVMISIIAFLDDPDTTSPFSITPSKHWAKCFNTYKNAVKESNLNSKQQLEFREKIFKDYVYAADEKASKNNLTQWSEFFPQIDLNAAMEMMNFSDDSKLAKCQAKTKDQDSDSDSDSDNEFS